MVENASREAGGHVRIKIRVQALGGKFLGDDIGGALVTIRDQQTGEVIASGRTFGNSGNLTSSYSAGASPSALITPSATGPVVQWLVPDDQSAHFVTDISVDRPRLLKVSARGPLGGLQSAHRVTATEWIVPGQSLDLLLVIPGLLVQVKQPATHTAIPQGNTAIDIAFAANVGMMCGCPISAAPNSPWVPSDFDVHADITPVNAPGIARQQLPLTYNSGGVPSLFGGTLSFTPSQTPAFMEAIVTARQISTGNIGTGTVTFFVKPPV
jgi:hypothetical protein